MINFTVTSLLTLAALGDEADWAFTPNGNVSWNSNISPNGGIVFDGAAEGEYAELTGCAVAVCDVAIPDSTSSEVTLNNYGDAGTILFSLKGGDPVEFVFANGGGAETRSVTSGTGSGYRMEAGDDTPQVIINEITAACALS